MDTSYSWSVFYIFIKIILMIKKTILLSFFLCCILGFSQKYEFDRFVIFKYKEEKNDKDNPEHYEFYSSINGQTMNLYTVDSKTFGSIFDFKTLMKHTFEVNQKGEMLVCNYISSEDFNKYKSKIVKEDKYLSNHFEISNISSNIFKIIGTSKKNKLIFELKVEIEPSVIDYLNVTIDHEESDVLKKILLSKLNDQYKYKVRWYEVKYKRTGHSFIKEIKKVIKTNLILELPQQLIMVK
jgi:hypothetical protein